MRSSCRVFALLAGLSVTTAANAATIGLSPQSSIAMAGGSLSFNLQIDFSDDPTLGGGLDIFYDTSLLDFQSFTTSTTTLSLDSSFTRQPDQTSTGLEGLAFGSFSGLETGTVGTLTFQALAEGSTILSMAVTSDPTKGGDFISASTSDPQSVVFTDTQLQINAVPVPAAVWLFGSGLIGLAGVARRRSA